MCAGVYTGVCIGVCVGVWCVCMQVCVLVYMCCVLAYVGICVLVCMLMCVGVCVGMNVCVCVCVLVCVPVCGCWPVCEERGTGDHKPQEQRLEPFSAQSRAGTSLSGTSPEVRPTGGGSPGWCNWGDLGRALTRDVL